MDRGSPPIEDGSNGYRIHPACHGLACSAMADGLSGVSAMADGLSRVSAMADGVSGVSAMADGVCRVLAGGQAAVVAAARALQRAARRGHPAERRFFFEPSAHADGERRGPVST